MSDDSVYTETRDLIVAGRKVRGNLNVLFDDDAMVVVLNVLGIEVVSTLPVDDRDADSIKAALKVSGVVDDLTEDIEDIVQNVAALLKKPY